MIDELADATPLIQALYEIMLSHGGVLAIDEKYIPATSVKRPFDFWYEDGDGVREYHLVLTDEEVN